MKSLLLPLLLATTAAHADPVTIVDASMEKTGMDWRVSVTLEHPDTGWDHYADGWRVETEDGQVLGTRTLHHPHVTEQPFTRSLSGVVIPEGTTQVQVQARTNVDGWADQTYVVTLP